MTILLFLTGFWQDPGLGWIEFPIRWEPRNQVVKKIPTDPLRISRITWARLLSGPE
jgi:hypothetical protein